VSKGREKGAQKAKAKQPVRTDHPTEPKVDDNYGPLFRCVCVCVYTYIYIRYKKKNKEGKKYSVCTLYIYNKEVKTITLMA